MTARPTGLWPAPLASRTNFERLFKAYFEEEKDITDFDTLAEVARDAKLEITTDKVKEYLSSDADVNEIRSEADDLRMKWGVTGVPFFILNQSVVLSGAQDPSAFVEAFDEVASKSSKV
eukprot:TRINITY_DN10963_c0_g1_i1.p2 TRINITY_DN10963_c0_g1~~TRINITY_DN10963_c0_g1_i1.p2  ORF type:complete len:119 (+),score=28.66 TRINITY_DN10963_c0_g1_i1:241-597(+)